MSSLEIPFFPQYEVPARQLSSSTDPIWPKGLDRFHDSRALGTVESSSSSGDPYESHYKFKTGGFIYAADARAQQASGPKYGGSFGNLEELSLSTSGEPWQHKPLFPGRQDPWQTGELPGPHRSVWTPPDTANFDVMSHDPSRVTIGTKGDFVLATYRPKKEKREELRKERKKKMKKEEDQEVTRRNTEERGEEQNVGRSGCSLNDGGWGCGTLAARFG